MSRLVLVRHGETVWHAEHRYAGTTDVLLTPRGREQAEALGRWAKTAGLAAVWASPLSRARETAAAAARATGLAVRVDERLRELHFGRAEGRTKTELGRELPAVVAAFLADPVVNHMPGGEDPAAAADRGVTCLRGLAGVHPEGRVLVVGHTTLFRLTLCRLLGLPLAEYRRVFPHVRNGALTEVRLAGDVTGLLQFNTPPEGA
ncbi:alpha-ribazole phosphatase [soil metagenome]